MFVCIRVSVLRKPTDLNPLQVIEGVRGLSKKLIIVGGEDRISKQAQVRDGERERGEKY